MSEGWEGGVLVGEEALTRVGEEGGEYRRRWNMGTGYGGGAGRLRGFGFEGEGVGVVGGVINCQKSGTFHT